MKTIAALAALIGLLSPTPQRFTSATSLLTVDATVTDKDGNAIPGLVASDFIVKINGKVQPVRAATLVDTTSSTSTLSVPVPGAAPTAIVATVAAPAREPRVFVLLLDDLSLRAGQSKGLLVSAERFVEKLPPQDIVGFTTTSGLVTVNPTTDRVELMKRLRRAQGSLFDPRDLVQSTAQVFVGTMEALQYDDGFQGVLLDVIRRECKMSPTLLASKRLEAIIADYPCPHDVERNARMIAKLARRNAADQLFAMENVIRAMGIADGIKHLVVVSGGIGVAKDVVDFIPVAKAAAAAGVQLSVMVEDPDDVDLSAWGSNRARMVDDRALMSSMQALTDMAGGQFFRVIGQAERFYDRVLRSSAAVYRLGVELPPDISAGANVTVEVEVPKRGASVHASRHSAAPLPSPPPPSSEEQVKRAIEKGTPAYAVPLQLDYEVTSINPSQRAVRVVISVPSAVPGPLSGVFGIVDDAGHLKSGKRTLSRRAGASSYELTFFVPVDPGTFRLRFAVTDANGAVGATEAKVIVRGGTRSSPARN